MVEWLVYHATHQALACKIHGYAVLNLASHLADKHGDVEFEEREVLIEEYSSIQPCRPPNYKYQHGKSNPIPAIDGLAIYNGLACYDYDYLSTSRKKLKVHCREEHNWQLSKKYPVHWTEVKLQTFFTSWKCHPLFLCDCTRGKGRRECDRQKRPAEVPIDG